jgi:hypothetical protein
MVYKKIISAVEQSLPTIILLQQLTALYVGTNRLKTSKPYHIIMDIKIHSERVIFEDVGFELKSDIAVVMVNIL